MKSKKSGSNSPCQDSGVGDRGLTKGNAAVVRGNPAMRKDFKAFSLRNPACNKKRF